MRGGESEWTQEVRLTLDDLLQAIFTFAQRTPSPGHHLRFVLENTVNVAAINSMRSIHSVAERSGSHQQEAGFAVDGVETHFIGHTIRCFDGLTIKVALTGGHAHQLKVGFQSTLTGWIKEFRTRGELG